jgi:acyl-CoA synthetase (AMP-forming)/AMP-acid ligase II
MKTVYDLVHEAAQRSPHHAAIIDTSNGNRLTYTALTDETDRVAAGLKTLGIESGDLVATILPNFVEHAVALLALARLGAVPVLINPRLKPQEVGALITQAGAIGALAMPDPAVIGVLRETLPDGAPIVTVGGTADGATDFADCHGAPDTLGPIPAPAPEDLALVFHTSGTTGLPKGVMVPHRAIESRVFFVCPQCGLRHGTHNRALGLMPLMHAVGFLPVFIGALALNGTYYAVPAFDPATAVEIIAEHQITYLFATPTHFHAMMNAPGFDARKVASVETLVYAGAAMPGAVLDRVGEAFDARITNIYGTTETMNTLYMPDPVGRPMRYRPGLWAGARIGRIGGSVHDLADDGTEGELLANAAADATFTGYLNRPDATAEKLQDGWYRTGDVFARLDDGDLEMRGRVDDMIVTGGENVHPEEVESVLAAHAAVADVAVIGVDDDRWGQKVVACIAAAGPVPSAADLDRHCRGSTLANYKRPRAYVFVDAVARNAAGKILRTDLRAEAVRQLSGAA